VSLLRSYLFALAAFLVLTPSLSGQVPVRIDSVRVRPGILWKQVPRVIGLPLARAEEQLRGDGLRSRVVEVVPREPEREGIVMGQDPQPDTRVRLGDTVTLFVPAPRVQVPDLVRSTQSQALEILKRNRLTLGRVDTRASRAPAGEVIAQVPVAHTPASPGDTVSVTISDPQLVTVPRVTGGTVEAADSALREAGLVVGSRREEPSNEPQGLVLAQDPQPETLVEWGSPVALTLAIAPIPGDTVTQPSVVGIPPPIPIAQWVPVPDVTGRTAEEARSILGRAGLGLGLEPGHEWADSLQQRIADQRPVAGDTLELGATVFVIPLDPGGFPWVVAWTGILLTLAVVGLVTGPPLYRNLKDRRNRRLNPRIHVRVKPGASLQSVIEAPGEPIEGEVRLRMRTPAIEPRLITTSGPAEIPGPERAKR
jgi:beta-lactam-binding protein with PASTA domain